MALALLIACLFVPCVGTLTVTEATEGFGFNNEAYLYFRDDYVFATSVDGGLTEQVSGDNASFADWMFFQEQDSDSFYGFYLDGLNATVNSFFVENVLELSVDDAGSVMVWVSDRGEPSRVYGASGVYSSVSEVSTLTVTDAGTVQLVYGVVDDGSGSGGVSGGSSSDDDDLVIIPTVAPTDSSGGVLPSDDVFVVSSGKWVLLGVVLAVVVGLLVVVALKVRRR